MNKEATDIFGNAIDQDKVTENDFDSKHIKFEVLIEEIESKLPSEFGDIRGIWGSGLLSDCYGNPLLLVFDKDTAKPYRRTILEKAKFKIEGLYYLDNDLQDGKRKIEETKKFIGLRGFQGASLKFIFWALFAMAVDKSDYDEKVAAIADFACMLKINEEILEDIIQVINAIFENKTRNIRFHDEQVALLFAEAVGIKEFVIMHK